MIDVSRALRVATDTGDVRFGLREVRRFLFPGTNVDLGAACGVPFSVAAVAVISPGESNILSV